MLPDIIFAENTLGTSSAYFTDNRPASMSAIDLNMSNLQEQLNSLPSAWFDKYTVDQDVIDLTLVSMAL